MKHFKVWISPAFAVVGLMSLAIGSISSDGNLQITQLDLSSRGPATTGTSNIVSAVKRAAGVTAETAVGTAKPAGKTDEEPTPTKAGPVRNGRPARTKPSPTGSKVEKKVETKDEEIARLKKELEAAKKTKVEKSDDDEDVSAEDKEIARLKKELDEARKKPAKKEKEETLETSKKIGKLSADDRIYELTVEGPVQPSELMIGETRTETEGELRIKFKEAGTEAGTDCIHCGEVTIRGSLTDIKKLVRSPEWAAELKGKVTEKQKAIYASKAKAEHDKALKECRTSSLLENVECLAARVEEKDRGDKREDDVARIVSYLREYCNGQLNLEEPRTTAIDRDDSSKDCLREVNKYAKRPAIKRVNNSVAGLAQYMSFMLKLNNERVKYNRDVVQRYDAAMAEKQGSFARADKLAKVQSSKQYVLGQLSGFQSDLAALKPTRTNGVAAEDYDNAYSFLADLVRASGGPELPPAGGYQVAQNVQQPQVGAPQVNGQQPGGTNTSWTSWNRNNGNGRTGIAQGQPQQMVNAQGQVVPQQQIPYVQGQQPGQMMQQPQGQFMPVQQSQIVQQPQGVQYIPQVQGFAPNMGAGQMQLPQGMIIAPQGGVQQNQMGYMPQTGYMPQQQGYGQQLPAGMIPVQNNYGYQAPGNFAMNSAPGFRPPGSYGYGVTPGLVQPGYSAQLGFQGGAYPNQGYYPQQQGFYGRPFGT